MQESSRVVSGLSVGWSMKARISLGKPGSGDNVKGEESVLVGLVLEYILV